jgi:hypothetical protein
LWLELVADEALERVILGTERDSNR